MEMLQDSSSISRDLSSDDSSALYHNLSLLSPVPTNLLAKHKTEDDHGSGLTRTLCRWTLMN